MSDPKPVKPRRSEIAAALSDLPGCWPRGRTQTQAHSVVRRREQGPDGEVGPRIVGVLLPRSRASSACWVGPGTVAERSRGAVRDGRLVWNKRLGRGLGLGCDSVLW